VAFEAADPFTVFSRSSLACFQVWSRAWLTRSWQNRLLLYTQLTKLPVTRCMWIVIAVSRRSGDSASAERMMLPFVASQTSS
jgi:hypothetical protein